MEINDLIIVHRGKYSGKYPENSIPAFRETLNKKMAIELDLHILKDGEVVVFHDDNLKRMCGVNKDIKNITLDEIRKYKLLDTNYSIPTFKDVLDLVNGKVLLDIELKYDVLDGSLEKRVVDILKDYNGEYILKSFHPLIVKRLKKLRRSNKMNYKVGLLVKKASLLLSSLIFINPDFISFDYKLLKKKTFKLIAKIKPALLYTIKNSDSFRSVKDLNHSIIVENFQEITK